ncbi:MAG: hypothetical protein ACR2MQ_05310, partial [Gemmatimonadaceae bacterium]
GGFFFCFVVFFFFFFFLCFFFSPTPPPPPPRKGATASSSAGASAAAAADNQPTVVGGHAIIRDGAVGPLQLNTWRRPVMSLVYAVGATAGPHGEDVIVVRGIGQDTLTLAFANDTLRWIDVNKPGPHTLDGVGVGTPFSAVTGQPGARLKSAGGVQTMTLDRYCGVEFRGDSVARSPAPATPVITSIVVAPCRPTTAGPAGPT